MGESDDDRDLANFLESEILSEQDDNRPAKRHKMEEKEKPIRPNRIESGIFCMIPPELFHHIFKFLSPEDLATCSLVCRFMNFTASDDRLWRRLYCLRWGPSSLTRKPRECAWKRLYIQRDQDDMAEFARNTPHEFRDYYIQMQAAKRSLAPLPSEVCDDQAILDKTLSDQVSSWKSSRGFSDEAVTGHTCTGHTCTYTQIGDVYICEKTGRVHVCEQVGGGICSEAVLDPTGNTLVCPISGQIFDGWIDENVELDNGEDMVGGVTDDGDEPFMGSGRVESPPFLNNIFEQSKGKSNDLRFTWQMGTWKIKTRELCTYKDRSQLFHHGSKHCSYFPSVCHVILLSDGARAFSLGYNCADEEELEATLRYC